MNKIVNILGILLLLFTTSAKAQEYLQIVSLEAEKGANAVFSSAGTADSKKGVETNGHQITHLHPVLSGCRRC